MSPAPAEPDGVEALRFLFEGGTPLPPFAPVLVGVVGSGNLEVLMEPAAQAGCEVQVCTASVGYGDVWRAVLADFHRRHQPAALRVAINDLGATPAVVGLRLAQALAEVRARTCAETT
jgi:malonate decarboxylase delta subunit